MAIERGRGARRFRTHLHKRRCYRKIAEVIGSNTWHHFRQPTVDSVNVIYRYYLIDEGHKHICGQRSHCCLDCGPGRGCDWHFAGIRTKYEGQVEAMDLELEEYGIFAPKTKPNRVWHDWKGRR
jgi:hypothetical protein